MSAVQITSHNKYETGFQSATFTVGKIEATVCRHSCGMFHVCCHNASNKAWNNGVTGGKVFRNFEKALSGYKSSDMKAVITEANKLFTQQ